MLRFCSATLGGAVQLVFCKSLAIVSVSLWTLFYGLVNLTRNVDLTKCQG